jgi:hypothetical protein
VAIVVLVVAYAGVLTASVPRVSGDSLRLNSFVSLAQAGRVQGAVFLEQDG